MKAKRFALSLALLAGFAHVAGPAPRRDDALQVTLRFRRFQSAHEAIALCAGGLAKWGDEKIRGYTVPDNVRYPTLFSMEFRGAAKPLVCLTNVAGGPAVVRLWVDWDQDKKFTQGECVKGSKDGAHIVMDPVPGPESGPIPRFRVIADDGYVRVVPEGCREGFATIGGKRVKVGLVDGDVTGTYNEYASYAPEADVLLVDRNGNGRFDVPATDYGDTSLATEASPLTRRVQMPDGRYYRVRATADGSRLTLERDPTPTGYVALSRGPFALFVNGPAGPLWVRSPGRRAAVPAGTYSLDQVLVGASDKRGGAWTVPISFYDRRRIRIVGGATKRLSCGLPLRLSLTIEPSGSDRRFSLSVKDRSGNTVRSVLTPNGGTPPEPILRIANAGGRLVGVEKFSYG